MRVLYSYPGRLGRTGIGATAWEQIAGLSAAGVDVTVLCGSREKALPPRVRVVETLRWGGIKLPYRIVGNERAWSMHDRIVARAVLRSAGGVDAVHCWPCGALATLTAAAHAGVPTFLERPNAHPAFGYAVVDAECRRLGVELPRSNPHRPRPSRLAHEEKEFAVAQALLCPSSFVAQTFVERGFPVSKLAVHQYGYDPVAFPTPLASELPRADAPLSAAFAGSCDPRKGLHYALEAWLGSGAAEHGGKFYICGKFVRAYRKALSSKLAHPSIEVVGYLSNPASVLSKAHLFIFPSIEEGSALVTYEARASGCVLLVSEATGARCRHGEDGLLHRVGDVATLTSQISSLVGDRGLFGRLRNASIAELSRLTWRSAAERLREIYFQRATKRSPVVPLPAVAAPEVGA